MKWNQILSHSPLVTITQDMRFHSRVTAKTKQARPLRVFAFITSVYIAFPTEKKSLNLYQ